MPWTIYPAIAYLCCGQTAPVIGLLGLIALVPSRSRRFGLAMLGAGLVGALGMVAFWILLELFLPAAEQGNPLAIYLPHAQAGFGCAACLVALLALTVPALKSRIGIQPRPGFFERFD